MEERPILNMSSEELDAYIERIVEKKIAPFKEQFKEMQKKLHYYEAKQKSVRHLLKERISLKYIDKYTEGTVPKGQHGLCKSVLMLYIAAYLAGLEDKFTYKEFNDTFETKITSSSYSNWTACYFYGAKHKGHLYTRGELIRCWEELEVSQDVYAPILDDLESRDLLRIK